MILKDFNSRYAGEAAQILGVRGRLDNIYSTGSTSSSGNEIVQRFGTASGLHVQPAKSKLIFLNKSTTVPSYNGIFVLQASDTVRYLGYEVKTGKLSNPNWAFRSLAAVTHDKKDSNPCGQSGTDTEHHFVTIDSCSFRHASVGRKIKYEV